MSVIFAKCYFAAKILLSITVECYRLMSIIFDYYRHSLIHSIFSLSILSS